MSSFEYVPGVDERQQLLGIDGEPIEPEEQGKQIKDWQEAIFVDPKAGVIPEVNPLEVDFSEADCKVEDLIVLRDDIISQGGMDSQVAMRGMALQNGGGVHWKSIYQYTSTPTQTYYDLTLQSIFSSIWDTIKSLIKKVVDFIKQILGIQKKKELPSASEVLTETQSTMVDKLREIGVESNISEPMAYAKMFALADKDTVNKVIDQFNKKLVDRDILEVLTLICSNGAFEKAFTFLAMGAYKEMNVKVMKPSLEVVDEFLQKGFKGSPEQMLAVWDGAQNKLKTITENKVKLDKECAAARKVIDGIFAKSHVKFKRSFKTADSVIAAMKTLDVTSVNSKLAMFSEELRELLSSEVVPALEECNTVMEKLRTDGNPDPHVGDEITSAKLNEAWKGMAQSISYIQYCAVGCKETIQFGRMIVHNTVTAIESIGEIISSMAEAIVVEKQKSEA